MRLKLIKAEVSQEKNIMPVKDVIPKKQDRYLLPRMETDITARQIALR